MSIEEEEHLSGFSEGVDGEGEYEEGVAEGEDEEQFEGADTPPAAGGSGTLAMYNAQEVNDTVFENLDVDPNVAMEANACWTAFLQAAGSREAAGESIYAALFDAAPSLQSLFKTPRAVMAMRFMHGLNQIVTVLAQPKALKAQVETLAFQHLDLEVTVPRVIIFRDAIVDLLAVELGARVTPVVRDAFMTLLNYIGGSFIYVRVKFSERLRILQSSWAMATKKGFEEDENAEPPERMEAAEGEEGKATEEIQQETTAKKASDKAKQRKKKGGNGSWFNAKSWSGGSGGRSGAKEDEDAKSFRNASVPQTYNDMFMFNAAVMGFGGHSWMTEVLASFDAIVRNVSNSYRLQEECDVLGLRMAKYKGTINLSEYKAVMLASLRSLVKDWGSNHEVAWSWLWQNVERMISNLMGKPAAQEKALAKLFGALGENELVIIRREVYATFFSLAPAGQDYFKQSTTRLHFIADKLVALTLEMYKEPKRMVTDLSALGLRHVGYGIPTDLFGPFVTSCVQVVRTLTEDDAAEEAFRWSLSLISRILCRVINEGSTIVMKAINANSGKSLKKAVACAPRGKRSLWVLNVTVGTQSISPLMWAVETGSLDAAKAIFVDLLTIRADRDRYYFGMDILFERHPDIIRRLCLDAPALLPVLLEGLIWRSRITENGLRRVNYYLRHLLLDAEGDFAKATEWLVDNNDPKLVCHPVFAMVTDLVWSRLAFRSFLYGKTWFLFTLLVFICSQSLLQNMEVEKSQEAALRLTIFVFRAFIYLCSMGQWMVYHAKNVVRDVRAKRVVKRGCLKVPEYLCQWQGWISLGLTVFLVLMLCMEPILHCIGDSEGELFTQECAAGDRLAFVYSLMSTCAMILYFLLLGDLSVFSTRVSAFALVCTRVVSEALLFLFGQCFFIAAFSCTVSSLRHKDGNFNNIPDAALNLMKITFGMFSGSSFNQLSNEPALLFFIILYVVTSIIFLSNLLIAQLNSAYQATYQDMVGYARLNRGKIVCETMPSVARWRWYRFVDLLRLDEGLEFGEGDIGVNGGIQIWEPAAANPTTMDTIRRYGGSTSPAAQWPQEDAAENDEEDRFDRMERLLERAMKRMTKSGRKGTGSSSGFSGSGSSLQGPGDSEKGSHHSGSE